MATAAELARRAVKRALEKGEIARPSECEWPEGPHPFDPDSLEGHHEDYARPLDVVWLCPTHHAALREALDAMLRVRLPSAELQVWKDEARGRDLSVSALVRDAVASYLDRPTILAAGTAARSSLVARAQVSSKHLSAPQEREAGPGGCTFDTPKGTKCKACQKVH